MYDEDNSREIDIREMESVMVVSRYLLTVSNVATCTGYGESQYLNSLMLYLL